MALVGRAARGTGFPRRHHRAARLAVGRRFPAPGQAEPVFRHHRRQHGFDGQPLHLGPQDPLRRCLHAGRRPRQAAGSRGPRLFPARAGSLRRRARGHRRHRGQPAPHRPLRLLVGQGAPLHPAGQQGRPAALRQRRARHRRTDPSPGPRREDRGHPRPARYGLHGAAGLGTGTGLAGSRRWRHADPREGADRGKTVTRLPSYEEIRRTNPLRQRLARLPSRIQPRQCPRPGAGAWRARRLAQPAADPADHRRDGPHLRPALRARAAPRLRRGEDPGLGDDPLLGEHHARLLRRLHLLLHHRARGAHHPEPFGRQHPARDRGDPRQDAGLHRRDLRPRRADREHVPHGLQGPEDRGLVPATVLRLSRHLREPRHRPRPADPSLPRGAQTARHQEDPHRLGPALRPRGAARPSTSRNWRPTTSAATSRSRPSIPRKGRCRR